MVGFRESYSMKSVTQILALELVSNFSKQLISQQLTAIPAPPFNQEIEVTTLLKERFVQARADSMERGFL
jgi:hypothetical protein